MKKVYICSPCRGDYENNIQRAKEFSRAAVERGCIPITPHIYLTQFMDDANPAEREAALKMGRELVLMCDELWAFGLDCPTAGMAGEIELARERGIPVLNGYKAITEPDEKIDPASCAIKIPLTPIELMGVKCGKEVSITMTGAEVLLLSERLKENPGKEVEFRRLRL